MLDLTEFNKLEAFLKENDIPYKRKDKVQCGFLPCERHIIFVPNEEHPSWDAAINMEMGYMCTYGAGQGLLEICGDIVEKDDDAGYYSEVEGYLTAEDVIERYRTMQS